MSSRAKARHGEPQGPDVHAPWLRQFVQDTADDAIKLLSHGQAGPLMHHAAWLTHNCISGVCVAWCLFASLPKSLPGCGIYRTLLCRLLVAGYSMARGSPIFYGNLRPDLLDLALKFEYADNSSYGGFRALSRWFYNQPWGSLTCTAGVNNAVETRWNRGQALPKPFTTLGCIAHGCFAGLLQVS